MTSIALFAQADHSLNVTSDVTLKFSSSKLHASFWLVVVACLLVVIATIFITLAIINVHRTEDRPEDKKSMISYDSVHKSLADSLNKSDDSPEEFKYREEEVPEAFPYTTESPYSTSSESFSESDESFDSDDSDIDPKFAKLKVKVTPKQEELEDDMLETKRYKSGNPGTIAKYDENLRPKSAGSSIHRNRSASALTPIEQTGSQFDIDVFADNPLYNGDLNRPEQSKAPIATNLIITAAACDSDDEFILRRAKTEVPFTQRMKATIDRKPKQIIDTGIRAPASIEKETDKKSTSLLHRTQSFPKKPKKMSRKRREPTEEEVRRTRVMSDIYNASPSIAAMYTPQQSNKPAPWSKVRSKMRLRPKTSTLLKWSLQAYGVESVPGLPKNAMPPTKSGAAPVTLENTGVNKGNSSNA